MQYEFSWYFWANWNKMIPKIKKKSFRPRRDSNPGRLGEPLRSHFKFFCFLLITLKEIDPELIWIHFCDRANVLVKMTPKDIQNCIPNCQKAVFHILTSIFSKRAHWIFLSFVPFDYPYVGLGWGNSHCPGSFRQWTKYG